MNSEHTRGPWAATHTDPAEGYDCWWITACPASNQEKEIATVSGGFPHDKHEANARLIAAAPELLEALEALAAEVGKMTADREKHPLMLGHLCEAKLAIAKARGEA